MYLASLPTGRRAREFYRIDRTAICTQVKIGKRLPQNTEVQVWLGIKLYNVPTDWIVGLGSKPINHCTVDSCLIGELDVRLLPFKPSYMTKSRWDSKLNKSVTYEVKVKTSTQRLEVRCPYCEIWAPFSRLNQHMFKPNGQRAHTCVKKAYRGNPNQPTQKKKRPSKKKRRK